MTVRRRARRPAMSQPGQAQTGPRFATPAVMFAAEPAAFEDEFARRCFRVLRMVAALHGKGFHGLRVLPYKYPVAYRIELFPASHTDRDGVKNRCQEELDRKGLIPRHSGANAAKYIGWEDAAACSAQALALKFIQRYPALAQASYHLDFAYAGWYATLLAHCEYGYLPYLFGEFEDEIGAMRLHPVADRGIVGNIDRFPLPPSPSSGLILEPQPTPAWLTAAHSAPARGG